ncbi:tetratricopeptide repeat protein [Aromatoleum diolicum]|uniref:Tetratricopeptide repeat protein n=1 Tax=Aromatoleum diolicum TaxID=75796 RepID=A0ABX1Q7K4_9RHOO|nr:tetratricopeptide repeat protein [Aromatoleum diolicum]NMG74346.1 tetratricopeptide repeat protein [Aromatoleum diolicum]
MNKFALTLKPVLAALVLGACSTSPTMPVNAWKVAPVQTVRHGGSNATGYFALGRYKEGQGANEQAIAAYRKALEADPGYAAAWSALGSLQVQMGQFDDGLKALERAVSITPSASHLHNNLGYALQLAGRDEAAVASLRRAVELDGNNRRAWSNLATTYQRLGMQDKAEFADARASGAWPPAPAPTGHATRPATTAPATAAATATATAVTVSPVSTVSPISTETPATTAPMPLLAVPNTVARPFDQPASKVERPAPVSPATVPALSVSTTPRTVLVKVANNVFELHNGPAKPAAAVLEAAAIIAAVAPPSVPAPAPSVSAPTLSPTQRAATEAAGSPAPVSAPVAAVLRSARYEIANGHGGEGLARRLAALLGKQGVARPRLTNQQPYNQPASYVEYRDGYRDAAEAFAARLPFRPTIQAAASNMVVDVRLMLGRDLTTSDACAALGLCSTVARVPAAKLAVARAPLTAKD